MGIRLVIGSLIALVAVAAESRAADGFWGNRFGGTFVDPFNWQDGFVPGLGDIAHFGLTINPGLQQRIYTVSFTASATNQAMNIEDDFVTFDLNAMTYATTLSAGNVIGTVAGRSGRLTITDGIMSVAVDSELLIGSVANASGSLTVTTGGEIRGGTPGGRGRVVVGDLGTGSFTVENGAQVKVDGTVIGSAVGVTGTANLTGASSQWVNSSFVLVGASGHGTLNITDGQVQSTVGSVGGNEGGTGVVTVSGTNSRWTNSQSLVVGDGGNGTLNITGGQVHSTVGSVGGIGGGTGTVNVDGPISRWINIGMLSVGDSGSGTVNITNGGLVQNTDGFVGNNFGRTGTVNVGGFQAQWISSGVLNVGNRGQGALLITVGGEVRNTDGIVGAEQSGIGDVIVRELGSTWTNNGTLSVGHLDTGTLTIEDGGSVSCVDSRIGFGNGSIGSATVTGAGSTWTSSSQLHVGFLGGTGTLTIEGGGSVTDTSGHIASQPGSDGTVSVTGAGSTWSNQGPVDVGPIGRGTLTIESGGSVSSTQGFLGHSAGSTGTATVSGPGSTWTTGPLLVGVSSRGELSIIAGGKVESTIGTVAEKPGSLGTVTVSGADSTWTVGERLSIGGNADTDVSGGAGTLNIRPGGTVSVAQDTVLFNQGLLKLEGGALDAAAIRFQGGGQFQWTAGTLTVDVYHGDLTNPDGGTLAPGRSAGSTTITGNYTLQAGAKLEIEIGGLSGGVTHDLVDITGGAFLGGELQLAMLNDFVPTAGSTFTVLDAVGGIFGVFANVTTGQRLTTVDRIGSFLVHYGAGSAFAQNQIILTDFEFTLGDCDHDGHVDLDDFALFPDCLGGPGVPHGAVECECIDMNADDDVDLRDFAVFQAGFTGP